MPGTITIIFDGIAGEADAVSPALPRILQLLARRGVHATFHLEPGLAVAEPLATLMIENGGHAIGVGAAPPASAAAAPGSSPGAWHPQMQVAVGEAARGEPVVLSFALAALERGDALGAFGETLDLIAGLRRAGSLEVIAP